MAKRKNKLNESCEKTLAGLTCASIERSAGVSHGAFTTLVRMAKKPGWRPAPWGKRYRKIANFLGIPLEAMMADNGPSLEIVAMTVEPERRIDSDDASLLRDVVSATTSRIQGRVLWLLAEGASYGDISRELGISPTQVGTVRASALRRVRTALGLDNLDPRWWHPLPRLPRRLQRELRSLLAP